MFDLLVSICGSETSRSWNPTSGTLLVFVKENEQEVTAKHSELWCHVTSCDVTWRAVMSCDELWCHRTSCDVTGRAVMSRDGLWCHRTSCDVTGRAVEHKLLFDQPFISLFSGSDYFDFALQIFFHVWWLDNFVWCLSSLPHGGMRVYSLLLIQQRYRIGIGPKKVGSVPPYWSSSEAAVTSAPCGPEVQNWSEVQSVTFLTICFVCLDCFNLSCKWSVIGLLRYQSSVWALERQSIGGLISNPDIRCSDSSCGNVLNMFSCFCSLMWEQL